MTLDMQDVDAIVAFVRQATFAGSTSWNGLVRPDAHQIRELDAAERMFRNAVINETNKPRYQPNFPRSPVVTYVGTEELADLRKLHAEVRNLIFNSNGMNIAVGELWKRIGPMIARLECVSKPDQR